MEPEPPDHSPFSQHNPESYINTPQTPVSRSQPSSYLYEHYEESEEGLYECPNPPKREEKSNNFGSATYRVQAHSKPTSPKKRVNKRSGYISKSLFFSGYSKNPDVYLQWETNMKQWLRTNNIPKEEKLSYAIGALTGDAYTWWLKEDAQTFYNKPVLDWGDLKARMYREFVKKHQTHGNITTKHMCQTTSRNVMNTPQLQPVRTQKFTYGPELKKVTPNTLMKKTEAKNPAGAKNVKPASEKQVIAKEQGTRPLPEPKEQCKSSKLSKAVNTTCYRCHKRGHFATTCPSRKMLKDHSSPELKSEISRSSDSLPHSDILIPSSRLMHLSLPKSFDPGIIQEDGSTSRDEELQESQIKRQTCSKEIDKEDDEQSEALLTQVEKEKRHELTTLVPHSPEAQNPTTTRERLGEALSISRVQKTVNPSKPTSKETIILQLANSITVSLSITRTISNILNSDMMPLFLFQMVETISGYKEVHCKEVPADKHLVLGGSTSKETSTNANKGVKLTKIHQLKQISNAPGQSIEEFLSYLLKGEPPDVPHINKTHTYQGKTLRSQKRMKANFLSLGAGDTVSRSKLFQEGEYDADLKSSSTKEHRIHSHEEESMNLRRAKEIGELSSAQMEVHIKHLKSSNPWRSYSTHSEFHQKKNQPKRILHEEVIEDTIWKIFNGPDGDMRPLNESFRPDQDEPRNKSNCFGFSTHQRKKENLVHDQIRFGSRVIDFTNRLNQSFPYLDTRSLIEECRPNQEELSYESQLNRGALQIGFGPIAGFI